MQDVCACSVMSAHVSHVHVQLFETPWSVALQAPLSMDSPRILLRIFASMLISDIGL